MEIVVQSKKSLFQQKFQMKLYHFNRNSQFKSVITNFIKTAGSLLIPNLTREP